jgi:hypothetical protein
MKYLLILCCLLSLAFLGCGQKQESSSIVWRFDNLDSIDGNRPSVLGAPVVIDSPSGKAIQFDGEDDALVFDLNPLAGSSAFTLETVFRPDAGGKPEQRFIHMQEVDDHRVLIETRLTSDGQWFLDTFLKSGESERTLFAKEFLHPVGEWFHAALVYENGGMRHYVNGVLELEGTVTFQTMADGQTSAGSRLNRVFWFKGAIKEISVTPQALSPSEFVLR